MKVLAAFAFLLLVIVPPSEGKTIHQIELRGHSRIFSVDIPVRQGRLYLFHRYPDGVYMSVPAEDVLGIAVTKFEDKPKPSDTVLLGPTGEGRPAEATPSAAASGVAPDSGYDLGYPGYYGSCYGCYGPPVRPPRPEPVAPSTIGPNGFPILPGSPPPPPIGSNGYPILAPPPPRPSPR